MSAPRRAVPRVRIVGAGRAGRSFALAFERVGWTVAGVLGRSDDVGEAAAGVDLVLLAVPDGALAAVAAAIRPDERCVVAHCSGACTLDVLAPHRRRAAIHPLMTLPTPELGAERLLAGAWFAVAGDPIAAEAAAAFAGHAVHVADTAVDRARYHAAACIAANHLVALLGQVERVAALAGVPLAAYEALARAALDHAVTLGPRAALTGPVARGDWATVEAHRAALPDDERPGYDAGVALATRLLDR